MDEQEHAERPTPAQEQRKMAEEFWEAAVEDPKTITDADDEIAPMALDRFPSMSPAPRGTKTGEQDVCQSKDRSVHLPDHYARWKIEPIRFIMENRLPFWMGNIIKYILRADYKNGIEDLKKARRYLDMQIKKVEGDPDWWK